MNPWLVGGITIVTWIVLVTTTQSNVGYNSSLQTQLDRIPVVFAFLGLLINTPHFIYSYYLAYWVGRTTILKSRLQLIYAPALLILLFLTVIISFLYPAASPHFLAALDKNLSPFGLNLRLSNYSSWGTLILGLLFVIQYHALGWHYSKQTYGVTLFAARNSSYPLSPNQKKIIKYALFGIWFCYISEVNRDVRQYKFGSLTYYNLGWPSLISSLCVIYTAGAFFAVIYYVLLSNYRKLGVVPNASVIASFASLYLWFIPSLYLLAPNYFQWVVPFGHSLQYLVFVKRYEDNAKHGNSLSIGFTYLLIIFLGFIFFDLTPSYLDSSSSIASTIFPSSKARIPPDTFSLMSFLFINLHHYWIDNAIWRRGRGGILEKI